MDIKDGIRRAVGQGANKLYTVKATVENRARKVRENPLQAAKRTAETIGDVIIKDPLRTGRDIAVHTGKAIYEPIPWAGKSIAAAGRGISQKSQDKKTDKLERQKNDWVQAAPRGSTGQNEISADLVNQLRSGLAGVFANSAALQVHQKSIKFNTTQYALHAANLIAVKAGKAAIVGVAAHAFMHGPLLHMLAPPSEEELFDKLGLTTNASRLGAGVGLLAIAEKSFSSTLENSNIEAFDRELGNYAGMQDQIRRDQRSIEKALAAAETLMHANPDHDGAAQGKPLFDTQLLKSIQDGLKTAKKVNTTLENGKLAEMFPNFVPDASDATSRADNLIRHYGLGPLLDSSASSALTDTKPGEQTPASKPNVLPAGIQKWNQKRKLTAQAKHMQADANRYQKETDKLIAQHDGTIPPNGTPMGRQYEHLSRKKDLAEARSLYAQNRLTLLTLGAEPPIDSASEARSTWLQASAAVAHAQQNIPRMETAVEAFRTWRDHPAFNLTGGDWAAMRMGYVGAYNKSTREIGSLEAEINKALASIAKESTPVSVKNKTRARVQKLEVKLNMAKLKQDQSLLNLAIGISAKAKTNRPEEKESPALKAAHARAAQFTTQEDTMLQFVKNKKDLQTAEVTLAGARDAHHRTSDFVKSNEVMAAEAPSLIRTLLSGAKYSVAVVPVVNLPYWGARHAYAFVSDLRFKKAMLGADSRQARGQAL